MRDIIAITLAAAAVTACSSPANNNAADANGASGNTTVTAPAPDNADDDAGDVANLGVNAGAGAGTVTIYSAGGSRPDWALNISRGVIAYSSQGGPVLTVPAPAPQSIPGGLRYATPQLTVTITHRPCRLDDQSLSDTVQVVVAGRTLNGCGGQ